jgi:hypothetical protein
MHFFGFAILAIAVFGREAQIVWEAGRLRARALGPLALRMVPFALPVAWLAVEILTGPPSPTPSITRYGNLLTALEGLKSPLFSFVIDDPILDGAGRVGAAILIVLAGGLALRRGMATLDRRLVGPVLALAVAALAAPWWLNGIAWVQLRVPVALALILIAGSCLRGLTRGRATLLAVAVGAVILGRGVAMERLSAAHSADMTDLVSAGEALPAGARVLALRAPGIPLDSPLSVAQSYLVVEHDVFVPSLFQGTHVLRVRDAWLDHTHWVFNAPRLDDLLAASRDGNAPPHLRGWEDKFTHVLLMGAGAEPLEDPRLTPLAARGRMALYAVTPGGVPDT